MTVQEKTYEEIVTKVASNLQLPYEVVDKTYKAYWLFIRTRISALPLKEDLTEKEFSKLQTNINIPSLGKLTCTYDRYIRIKKRLQFIKHLKDKNDSKED